MFIIFERWVRDYLLNAKERFNKKPTKTLLKMLYLEYNNKELYFTLTSVAMIYGTDIMNILKEKYGEKWLMKIKI